MTEGKEIPKQTSINAEQLARVVRFGLVAIVLLVSFFPIHCSLKVFTFKEVWEGMKLTLPPLTLFVVRQRHFLIVTSLLVPLASIATLFMRNYVRSFYWIAVLALITMVHIILFFQGIIEPIPVLFVESMTGGH
ncbi:MAG: hypothetical protein M3Y82_06060 [Verrucomicrobiota bacterium]|nr:hypothetical protein [Verrucomicrobiota bacterium]